MTFIIEKVPDNIEFKDESGVVRHYRFPLSNGGIATVGFAGNSITAQDPKTISDVTKALTTLCHIMIDIANNKYSDDRYPLEIVEYERIEGDDQDDNLD